MKVRQLMTRTVRTCQANDRMSLAAHVMWDQDCGCVPVVDHDGRLLGMITDRDIAMAAYTQNEPISAMPVSRAMSQNVVALRADETLEAAEQLMQRHRVRRLPVIDGDGQVVGLLSLNDVVLAVAVEPAERRDASLEHLYQTLLALAEHRPRADGAWL